MKTAMQDLEDKLKDNLQWIVMNADYELMQKLFKEGIEKEKEQIVDAYRIASINNSSAEDMEGIKPEYWQVNAEMYYDKYFNQKK